MKVHTEGLPMFDFPVRPPAGPAEQRSFPIEEVGHRNHEMRWHRFRQTPEGEVFWAKLVSEAVDRVRTGGDQPRIGVKEVFEATRRKTKISVDNSWTAYAARDLKRMAIFADYIELRKRSL